MGQDSMYLQDSNLEVPRAFKVHSLEGNGWRMGCSAVWEQCRSWDAGVFPWNDIVL